MRQIKQDIVDYLLWLHASFLLVLFYLGFWQVEMQNLHKKVEGTSYDVEYSLKYAEQQSFFSLSFLFMSVKVHYIFFVCALCTGALSML